MSVQTQIKTDIHKRLNAMHTARATWEEGTLRASNDELYAILESVYALFTQNSKRKLASGEHSLPYSQTWKSKLRQIPVLP